jgi:dihydrofolate synthase/folylpolyglutamate synthase
VPADTLILEVGMGGRLDATNVVPQPAVTAIAALGFDHQQWLGATLAEIAGEKAGIAKQGVPLVTLAHPPEAADRVREVAASRGAPLLVQGEHWRSRVDGSRLVYSDATGELPLPLPALLGPHQQDNAALAVAMLRHQLATAVPTEALARAISEVRWPARLQKLRPGPLTGTRDIWLDGGHNPQAAEVLAQSIAALTNGRSLHLVTGMLSTKDPLGLLAPFRGKVEQVHTITFDHPLALPASDLADQAGNLGLPCSPRPSLVDAIAHVPEGNPILIAGSLYLAGEVLAANGEVPD